IEDVDELNDFAMTHKFGGIDWSFDLTRLPSTPSEASVWLKNFQKLSHLKIRYHCPFNKVDIGHRDVDLAERAVKIFQRVIRLVAKAQGRYVTLHIGLGHDTTHFFSWDTTVINLTRLVRYGAERGVKLCLENLAWGWTSKPNLFEKLIRKSGAGITFDIGHAHACESVYSLHYDAKDFVTPHDENVYNAHIYHTEIPVIGHVPPQHVNDIRSRLDLLMDIGCRFWTLEIREKEGLIQTKNVIDDYLDEISFAMTEQLNVSNYF
ncbi:MAG: TIM barrel protein, partial [Desulfobacteraceae bacterium]